MKKNLIVLLVVVLPLIALPQRRYMGGGCQLTYAKLTIGPEFGAMAALVLLDGNEGLFKFGYSVGANVKVRPIFPFSFQVGMSFNNVVKTSRFYTTPIILNLHTKNDVVISAGPVFYFSANEKKVDFNNPGIGAHLGFSNGSVGGFFTFVPLSKLNINKDFGRLKGVLTAGIILGLDLVLIN